MPRTKRNKPEGSVSARLQICLSPDEIADFTLKKQQTGCKKDKELYDEMWTAYNWLMRQVEMGATVSSWVDGPVNTPHFTGLEKYRKSLKQKQAPG